MKLASSRNPGADLKQLPVGFDLRTISVVEGVRAALACGLVILANQWLGWPPLGDMALAALLTCICDIGGAIQRRIPALLAFTFIGAALWAGFGMLRGVGLWAAIPVAALAIFCTSFARVWGQSALTVGNLLSIVIVFALDRPLRPAGAAVIGLVFVAGGLWSTALTMLVWRLHPYQPARAAVAEVWFQLAALAGDLRALVRRAASGDQPDWDGHARAYRRAVRQAVEDARTVVMDLARMRGAMAARGVQALARLETGEQVFGALIALSDVMEHGTAAERSAGAALLRVLQPALSATARSIPSNDVSDHPKIARVLASALRRLGQEGRLAGIARTLDDRFQIMARLAEDGGRAAAPMVGAPPPDRRARVLGPVRANLRWDSDLLRHALRAGAVTAVALLASLLHEGTFTHWLAITVIVTMQPFFATTWQRALERVAGTVLGGLAGAVLAYLAPTPLALAALLFPLSVVTFSARQVSYGTYTACLTALVVVLFELLEPGHASWEIAGMRALYTVAGGLIAIAGSLLLWPRWEPDRLRRALASALAAHRTYVDTTLAELFGEAGEDEEEQARRGAGVTSNNLEASLARALQEPGRRRTPELEGAMLAAAILRRLAGPLAALHHGGRRSANDAWQAWRDWIRSAFGALERGAALPAPRPAAVPGDALARLVRQIDLLDGALKRYR